MKNKDVVFSSEKLEAREKLKRILIPVIALLVIAALVAAFALIKQAVRGTTFTGGEDTPYPYSWRNSNKGVMTLEIDNSASPGYTWITLDPDHSNMPVTADTKQADGRNRFTLTPSEAGRHSTYFILMGEDGEASAKLDMLLETVENAKGVLETTVLSSSVQRRQVASAGGEGTYYPYSYSADTDGFIVLTISGGAVVRDWEASCDNIEAADYAGPFYEDNDVMFYILPGTRPGECNAVFSSINGAVSIRFALELEEDGTLLVKSDSIEGGDTIPADPNADVES